MSQIPNPFVIPVYVPRPDTFWREHIRAGSGVVGDPGDAGDGTSHDRREIWYEGGSEFNTGTRIFADRVHIAAGRMVTRYPTSAFGAAPIAELILVGTFDYEHGTIALDSDESAAVLASWMGVESVAPEELVSTDGTYEQRRMWERALRDPSLAPMHRQARRFLERARDRRTELLAHYNATTERRRGPRVR